jgi:arabinofuranosyltransferase
VLLSTRGKTIFGTALVFSWGFFLYVLANSAWVAEDAFITFRSVLNFVNGYGPVWNVGERVQVFTHPLWFLLLSFAKWMTGYLIYAALFLSMFFALTSLVVLQLMSLGRWTGLMLLVILGTSRAFVEYSSSGLENALAAFLLGLFCWITFYRPRLWLLVLIAALLTLCRMDFVLLILPTLLYSCWQQRKTINQWLLGAILAALPLCLWLVFSLIYYGSFFPNTYYAKLPDGFSHLRFFKQALNYFQDSATEDPTTLLLIISGSLIGIISGDTKVRLLVLGESLYLGYIAWIGGDYMTGRFFMVPAYCGAILLARCVNLRPTVCALLACLSIGLNLQTKASIVNNTVPKSTFIVFSSLNIINQRAGEWPKHSWLHEGSSLDDIETLGNNWHYTRTTCAIPLLAVGIAGLDAGPDIHIVDFLGITDPLLARLPSYSFFPGHFGRKIPRGYMVSLRAGKNLIEDPEIYSLYERVNTVVAGSIWTTTRWQYIMELLGGKWRKSVAHYFENAQLAADVPESYVLFPNWLKPFIHGAHPKNNEEITEARLSICQNQWDY